MTAMKDPRRCEATTIVSDICVSKLLPMESWLRKHSYDPVTFVPTMNSNAETTQLPIIDTLC